MEDKVKFALIVICFLISMSYGMRCANARDALLLRIAMLFTVLADFCLLVIYRPLCGVGLFCVVQFMYVLRYCNEKTPALLLSALSLFMFIFLHFVLHVELIYALSATYALCFCFNLFFVSQAFLKGPMPYTNRLLSLCGTVLFAACDVNVALYNISPPLTTFTQYTFVLIWTFYLPAQLLLSVSGKRFAGS